MTINRAASLKRIQSAAKVYSSLSIENSRFISLIQLSMYTKTIPSTNVAITNEKEDTFELVFLAVFPTAKVGR